MLGQIEQHPILTLSVSVDQESFLRSEAIASRSPLVIPAFGVHPLDWKPTPARMELETARSIFARLGAQADVDIADTALSNVSESHS